MPREPLPILKQIVTIQTEVCVIYLNNHNYMCLPSTFWHWTVFDQISRRICDIWSGSSGIGIYFNSLKHILLFVKVNIIQYYLQLNEMHDTKFIVFTLSIRRDRIE